MKKLLLTLVCALCAFTTFAQKTYTDRLVVTINGEPTETMSTVLYQDNGDGTCNFSLKNFVLSDPTTTIPVGNITIPGMPLTKGDSYDTFEYNGKIDIEDGDMDALPEGFDEWYAQILFADGLDVKLNGKVNDEKAYVSIYIDATDITGQIVEVEFGTDDFEDTPAQPVDATFCFVDKDGKELSDGAVVVVTEVKEDDFDGSMQMHSGLSIKNTTADIAHASLVINIERMDNGSLAHCFPGNCFNYQNVGEITRAETCTIQPGAAANLQSEWCPQADGTCTVTYTIRVMAPGFGNNYIEVAKGPSVTVHYNCDQSGIAKPAATASTRACNLQGQCVGADYRGIVIINGKKTVQ